MSFSGMSPTAAALLLAIISAYVLYSIRSGLVLIFAGVALAVFFRGAGNALSQKTGISNRFSTPLIFLVFFLVSSVVLVLVIPQAGDQFAQLRESYPETIESARRSLAEMPFFDRVMNELPSADKVFKESQGVAKQALGVLSNTFSGAASLAVIAMLSFYMALHPEPYKKMLLAVAKPDYRDKAKKWFTQLSKDLFQWGLGRLAGMVLVGVSTWIGLSFLGVPMATLLSLITALLTVVPNFGPLVSVVLAMSIALAEGLNTAFFVLCLYVGIQIIESNLVTPLIQQEAVSVPPALTLTAQIVFGLLFGIPGLVLAVPLVVGIRSFTLSFYPDRFTLDGKAEEGE